MQLRPFHSALGLRGCPGSYQAAVLRGGALLALCALCLGSSCGGKGPPPLPPAGGGTEAHMCAGSGATVDVSEEPMPDVQCDTGERILLCYGSWAAHCDAEGKLVALENCRKDGLVCATHKCSSADDCTGCRTCVPGRVQCAEGGELRVCKADGSGYEHKATCDEAAGQYCSLTSGTCEDLCASAEREHSYIGCDYWAVATSNSQLDFESQGDDGICHPFSFAVVVANPQGVEAEVTVHSPGHDERSVSVPPSSTRTVELPCSPELQGDPDLDRFSVQTAAAAHHITSNVPVTVYQFNPLEFQGQDAAGEKVYSYTNDSSLLLPTSSLTGNYVVVSQPTLLQQITPDDAKEESVQHSGPGFLAVIAADADPVEVEVTSSAYTLPSEDGSIPALAPGERHVFSLNQGETLQILSAAPDDCIGTPDDAVPGGTVTYCRVPHDFDLTGTHIHASGKVAVISGHDCVFLPYNRWACDHIEESMLPIEAWGKESYVTISEAIACQPRLPNMARVYSDTDDNRVQFVPAVHDPVTLNKGDFVQFEFSSDFHVIGSDAILVAQFLLGQDYKGRGSSGSFAKGDPSLSLGEPVEQWRKRYAFLAPETFGDNYVNIIAHNNQLVLLDGRAVGGFQPIEDTHMLSARVPITGGEHSLESNDTFGIVVYGYAPYTSYMMPGGLDLLHINGPD